MVGDTATVAHRRMSRVRWLIEPTLVVLTVGLLVIGGLAWLFGARVVADGCWIAATVVAVVPALTWVVLALRRGQVGVDIIAVLSLVGTLLVHEYLAGALIAVMLAGGRALDAAAQRRATRDLRLLLERAPRFARRRTGSDVSQIPLAEVVVNDILVVGPGEVVPVDGRIADVVAVLDESALTGEPLQVERGVGEPVRSGVVNAGGAFEIRASATADESTYAGIVRMAQQAGAENAPIVRLADRYAAWFLPMALVLAAASWLASGASRCRAGGRHAMPAAAGSTGRDRLRPVPRLTHGRGDSRWRRTGKPRSRNDIDDGQDRHVDDGAPLGGRRGERTR